VIGKITRLYLSMSLAVIPNILLISFGVTEKVGTNLGAAGPLGADGCSSSNLLLAGFVLLYLFIVFSLLAPLKCRLESCTCFSVFQLLPKRTKSGTTSSEMFR